MRVVAIPLCARGAHGVASLRRAVSAAMEAPELRPWEGPFSGAERRLPQHPKVRARQKGACRRWQERKRARELAAVESDGGAQRAASGGFRCPGDLGGNHGQCDERHRQNRPS